MPNAICPFLMLEGNAESETEIDRLPRGLTESGTVLMPVNNYGFSRKWVNDRFGVSWQLSPQYVSDLGRSIPLHAAMV